jgi:hypothetical protein
MIQSRPFYLMSDNRISPLRASIIVYDNKKGIDNSINIGIIMKSRIEHILLKMRAHPKNVRFAVLRKVCDEYFGPPRQHGSSHRVYRTPWPGDPRINIQNQKGMAKAYQVKQVLLAIDKLENGNDPEK